MEMTAYDDVAHDGEDQTSSGHRRGWWDGAPDQGINFWRPGEVIVLVETAAEDGVPPPDTGRGRKPFEDFLERVFEEAGHKLDATAFREAGPDRAVRISQAAGPLYMERVSLPGTPAPHVHDVDALASSLRQAVDAADALNQRRVPGIDPSIGYRVAAATLNWLAMPFHG